MTAQFRTLEAIIDDIQYRGNLAGYESRHPEATLKTLWNQSWQELRELVSFHEDGTFLTQTTPASLPTSAAVSGEVYAEVDWPTDAVAIYGVRVKSNNRWRPLRPLPVAAVHDYQFDAALSGLGVDDGIPRGYMLRTIPSGSTSTEVAGKIMIVPVPSTGQYSVWYLQAWTPITSDSDTVSGHAAFIEWSIWSTIIKARAKDGKRDDTYAIAKEERDKAEDRILTRARRLSEGLPMEPRDARSDGFTDYWDDL